MVEPHLDLCRLCGERRELQDSHILPRWTYDRAARGPEGRQPALVFMDLKRGTSILTNKQLKEYLLCFDCEQLFCKWEAYVAGLLVQDDGSFPWLEVASAGQSPRRIVDATSVDVETIARFAFSVVWRGSVCSELRANLGPYEGAVAAYLRNLGSLPNEACLLVHLLAKPVLQRSLVPPQVQNRRGYHIHWFVACGALFQVFVGRLVPPLLREGCIAGRRVVIVSDGSDLMSVLGPTITGTIPKGKLAKSDFAAGLVRR